MTQLGMFARYWQPGAVKTRLAATIGPEHASRFYRASVATLARRFATAGDTRHLIITPASRAGEFACFNPPWSVMSQAEGDLGQRIARFFATSAAARAGRAVLIGSDSPTLPSDYVTAAFELLRQVPVVLGPATDGGYYLIGCRTLAPELFEGIAWSTSDVRRQTIERLVERQIPYAELPLWYDIDDLPDLLTLHRDLQEKPVEQDLVELRQVVSDIVKMIPAARSEEVVHSTQAAAAIQSVTSESSVRRAL